jgi:hypothetical protein
MSSLTMLFKKIDVRPGGRRDGEFYLEKMIIPSEGPLILSRNVS